MSKFNKKISKKQINQNTNNINRKKSKSGSSPASQSETHRPHRKVAFTKPGNALYPAPSVLVSCRDPETHENNVFTVGWTGTVCTNPPMLSISVRPERYSYSMIKNSGVFAVNLTNEALAYATDFCGVKSGKDVDKFAACNLTAEDAKTIDAPTIKESPLSIECKIRAVLELGSHHMFIADVTCIQVDEAYMDDNDTFHLDWSKPIAYSHGKYYKLGKELGHFGWSVRKKKK